MRQAPGFRRPSQNRTSHHHQRERSRQFPYPTPNHSPSAQNAFQCPPRSSITPKLSPVITLSSPLAPPRVSTPIWNRSSSPAPRKLGNTTFQYRNLDASHQEVRLLRILPKIAENTPIECEILHTSLNDPRSYIAISYAWGDADNTQIIVIDGHEFPVTVSLWQALKRLQSTSYAVIVWADAVCINQRNSEERGIQVQLMARIYNLAFEVMVWLGPEDDDSHLAIDLVRQVSNCHGVQAEDMRLRNIIKSPLLRSHFRALVCLFDRPYWTRLWVVQEVFNAKNVSIYCGSESLSWDKLSQASLLLRQHRVDLMTNFPIASAAREAPLSSGGQLADVLAYNGPGCLANSESPDGLLQGLCWYRDKSCVDPRDKVYGLLGVLSDRERSDFPIDYTLSTREVYIGVVKYLIATTGKLDSIRHAIHFPPSQNPERLPSWVPDWSHKPSCGVMAQSFSFSAAKNTEARCTFTERGTKMAITGIRIDSIFNSAIHISPPVSTSAVLMTIFQWRLALLGYVGFENITAHETFCLALCLGHLNDDLTRTQWMERVYHILATSLKQYYPALELDHQLTAFIQPSIQVSEEVRNLTLHQLSANLGGRRFFMTSSGLICLGSGAGHPGDILCVPLGCSTPIIIRERKGGYEYVGDVYVDGYMYGKAIDELKNGERKLETFLLQ